MVLKKIASIIIFVLSTSIVFSQSNETLFYSDIYDNNYYLGDKQEIHFFNNFLPVLKEETLDSFKALIDSFSNSTNIKLQEVHSNNPYLLSYTVLNNISLIDIGKKWHSEFEENAKKILLNSVSKYKEVDIPIVGIQSVLNYKLTLLQLNNKFILNYALLSTHLNIVCNNINTEKFYKNITLPSYLNKRLVSKSFQNDFNEAFAVNENVNDKYIIYGPSKSSRIEDWLSLELFSIYVPSAEIKYLPLGAILVLDSFLRNIDSIHIDQNHLKEASRKLLEKINNKSYTLFNKGDYKALSLTLELYSQKEMNRFINQHIKNKIYSKLFNVKTNKIPYNFQMLNTPFSYKVNTTTLYNKKEDSVRLKEIAMFLKENPNINVTLLSSAHPEEYMHLPKNTYDAILEEYKNYDPVFASKKMKLDLYRSLLMFKTLIYYGANPRQLKCIANKKREEKPKTYLLPMKK